MAKRTDCYTLHEAAALLCLSYDAIRAKIYRGTIPAIKENGRVRGIPRMGFWQACAQLEAVGKIRERDMTLEYRAERLLYLGKISYDSNVLYGKKGTRA